MPSALVEDDEEGGEQELDGQESAGKFTEKVCSAYPEGLQAILLFGTDILIQNETK